MIWISFWILEISTTKLVEKSLSLFNWTMVWPLRSFFCWMLLPSLTNKTLDIDPSIYCQNVIFIVGFLQPNVAITNATVTFRCRYQLSSSVKLVSNENIRESASIGNEAIADCVVFTSSVAPSRTALAASFCNIYAATSGWILIDKNWSPAVAPARTNYSTRITPLAIIFSPSIFMIVGSITTTEILSNCLWA